MKAKLSVLSPFCLSHCPSSDSSEILSMDFRRSATSCRDSAPETSCLEWGREAALDRGGEDKAASSALVVVF